MILHTVNKSAYSTNVLTDLAQFLAKSDLVLLIEDGVLGLNHSDLISLNESCSGVYALDPDIKARGIDTHVPDFVTCIDYEGFVDLTLRCHSVRNT
ncbi:MAG: sulfurtransferase complex subunit TusB [Pseudomonadales bacterium]|jgi:tRNA 2-thiouridine synthesizing protein B|nr:sulfurtransferase complex subunit TusB [Pseudomonadales bacterium]MDG1441266.1 sulfurtransferase complex subunit TusB [Pseudomonadales bacterium]